MISHNKPTVEKNDIAAVSEVMSSGFLSQGQKTAEFEAAFSRMHHGYHAVAVNSGTSALHLALLALNVKKGDEVIIPSYVCAALLNAVNYAGAAPRFADIDPEDFNLSVSDVKRRINKRTKAVIVPHLFGKPAKIQEFVKLGVPVIEDCAQSVGASINGKLTGTFGEIAIFSFYSTKVITSCGEGGMLLTRSFRLKNIAEGLRDYDEKDDYSVRYNYKMSNVAAAMGLSQLRKLDKLIAKRRAIAKFYDERFKGKDFFLRRDKDNIYFRYLIRIVKNQAGFLKKAIDNKIGIKRPIYLPLHKYFRIPDESLPHTSKIWESVFSIPIYPTLTKKEIEKVVHFLV